MIRQEGKFTEDVSNTKSSCFLVLLYIRVAKFSFPFFFIKKVTCIEELHVSLIPKFVCLSVYINFFTKYLKMHFYMLSFFSFINLMRIALLYLT